MGQEACVFLLILNFHSLHVINEVNRSAQDQTAIAHICAPGQTQHRGRVNGTAVPRRCHLQFQWGPHYLSSAGMGGTWDQRCKPCGEWQNDLLAVLPQAFLWGTTCAALTRRWVDYPILSCGCGSLISAKRCSDSAAGCWHYHMFGCKLADRWLFIRVLEDDLYWWLRPM